MNTQELDALCLSQILNFSPSQFNDILNNLSDHLNDNDNDDFQDINLDGMPRIDSTIIDELICDLNNGEAIPSDIAGFGGEAVASKRICEGENRALNDILCESANSSTSMTMNNEDVVNQSLENILNLNDDNEIELAIAESIIRNNLEQVLDEHADEIIERNKNYNPNVIDVDLNLLPLDEAQRLIVREFKHLSLQNFTTIHNWQQGVLKKEKWHIIFRNVDSPQTLIESFIEIAQFIRTG